MFDSNNQEINPSISMDSFSLIDQTSTTNINTTQICTSLKSPSIRASEENEKPMDTNEAITNTTRKEKVTEKGQALSLFDVYVLRIVSTMNKNEISSILKFSSNSIKISLRYCSMLKII